MADVAKMFETLNIAVMASDTNFKIIYANDKCRERFKISLSIENLVGMDMADCHKPETMDKIKTLYQEFAEKKKKMYYYTMNIPDGKLTIVEVPFYDGDNFAGVVEFIFEGSLA
jgi:PAS domain S-box-containing protein